MTSLGQPKLTKAKAELARQLDAELERRWELLQRQLQDGTSPTAPAADEIERIAKLRGLLPKAESNGRALDVSILGVAAALILASTLIRLPSAEVDLDVRVSGIKFDLAGSRAQLLIPGELGEILPLSHVRITGAEESFPPTLEKEAVLEIQQLKPPEEKKENGTPAASFPVRLQMIEIPADVPVTMSLATAYALNKRGLTIGALSTQRTRAQFGEVIEVGPVTGGAKSRRRAIRPFLVTGKAISIDLFPVQTDGAMTVFRDLRAPAISFQREGGSSVLAGEATVKAGPTPSIVLQAGDRVDLRSLDAMLLREVTFDKTGIRVKLTASNATTFALGERNLIPTLFDWLRFRWPTQLWGAIGALVTLWLATRRWWRGSQ